MTDFDSRTDAFAAPPPRRRDIGPMNPLRALGLRLYHRTLSEKGSALTFARLCTSRHLADLQWIAVIVLGVVFLALAIVATGLVEGLAPARVRTAAMQQALSVIASHGALAGVLLTGATAVLNWIYQTANRRIGTVDLFACEISVICRVCLVADLAQTTVDAARRSIHADAPAQTTPGTATPATPTRFSSEEHYTPVYDTRLGDLVPLDVGVVTSVTEFYTYRKTMVDYMRAGLAATSTEDRERFAVQMIYVQFLMYESARACANSLIEFDPNRAESLVNILCSELVVYGFLATRFGDDFRARRLQLRRDAYPDIVTDLLSDIRRSGNHDNWRRARTTARELIARYRQMCADIGMDPAIPIELDDF